MLQKRTPVLLVLLTLFAAFVIPFFSSGWLALNRAQTSLAAADYGAAAESFSRAALFFPWRGDLWERAGVAAAKAQDYSRSVAYFRRAVNLSEEGWIWLGASQLSLGDAEGAVSTLRRGLQVYDSAAMYRLLAAAHREQKDWKEERAALENQLRLDPSDAYASYRLGLLLTVFAPERALTYLTFAASLDPQFDPAVQTLRSALNLSAAQPSASQQMATLGRALGLVKEWDLAGLAFEKAIALDEENAEAWAWLGEAKQQVGQDGTAELDKAVSLDPASVVARGLRALYWSRQGKYPLTLAEYALAAKYEPENPAWQVGMGSAYAANGDLVSALSAYQRAVELAPNEAAYWSLLAVFCADYGIYLEEIGLPAANKAMDLSPDDPASLDALGWVYLSSGRYASAEQVLSDAAARFPDSLPISIHLAMTYLAQGNRPAAFETLTRVKSLDPRGDYGETAARLLERYFP